MDTREAHIDYIEFPASDNAALARFKAFYGAAFQWQFQDWADNYADTASSGLNSGVNADAANRPAKPLAVLYAADLEAARDRILAAGGTLTLDIFAFPGGRRFHFLDPAGNELGVWSDQGI